MTTLRQPISLLTVLLFAVSPMFSQTKSPTSGDPDLAKKIARFAPTELTANTGNLTAKDKLALTRTIQAAKLLDPLFLRQVWRANAAREKNLRPDTTPAGRQRLHYFYINEGPGSQLNKREP